MTLLLLLLACDCESELGPLLPDAPGTYRVCAGTVPTDLELYCASAGEPYVFEGAGMDETTLVAAGGGGALTSGIGVSGCAVELRDLTLTGGFAEEEAECADDPKAICGGSPGAALVVWAGSVALTRVRITGNEADFAGAGTVYGGSLTLEDAEVSFNVNGGFFLGTEPTLVSLGTTWAHNDGADVILPDREVFEAGERTDFTCVDGRCE